MRIRSARAGDGPRLVEIWRGAVAAPHDFLAPADRDAIDREVSDFLPAAPALVAVDGADVPLGFMPVDGASIEALFVDPVHHGAGIGRALIGRAMQKGLPILVEVNEANRQARGFYAHLGFVEVGRAALDGQGRPYPLVRLQLG